MLDMAVRMGRCKAYVDYHWRHTRFPIRSGNYGMTAWACGSIGCEIFVDGFHRTADAVGLKQLESVGLNEEYSRQSAERHYARFGLARL